MNSQSLSPSFPRKRESMVHNLVPPTVSTDIQAGSASLTLSAPEDWAWLDGGLMGGRAAPGYVGWSLSPSALKGGAPRSIWVGHSLPTLLTPLVLTVEAHHGPGQPQRVMAQACAG